MKPQRSYDFYLILATAAVLFIISFICIYGMFSFKLAQVHQMPPAIKADFMERMNTLISPFIIILIILLGICVPKRLLSVVWLNRVAVLLAAAAILISYFYGVVNGLLFILAFSALLQCVVLALAISGSTYLHFEKKGYWVRLGSSLIHLGLIMFVLDLFFFQYQALHLILFWITTAAMTTGMICSFYAENVVGIIKGRGID